MFRVDRKTLQVELEVKLASAMRAMRTQLRSKTGAEREAAELRLVQLLINEVDNPSSCVVRADDTRRVRSNYSARGEFGVDEDWPALLDMERHTPPDRSQMTLPLDGL
jgi:hypothetical protein